MPANENFLNLMMSTLGDVFDGKEDRPRLLFQEIPLFTDPSELKSGTCYVDIDEMNTPGILEGEGGSGDLRFCGKHHAGLGHRR